MAARVMVFARIRPGDEEAFERAFAEVAAKMRGTPGHIREELLRDPTEPDSYVLVGDWTSRSAFQEWFDSPGHEGRTTPMRQYWEGRAEHHLYEVTVRAEPGRDAQGVADQPTATS